MPPGEVIDRYPQIRRRLSSYSLERSRPRARMVDGDRKSTRLNSSHDQISYAVFCLKKKKTQNLEGPKPPDGTPDIHELGTTAAGGNSTQDHPRGPRDPRLAPETHPLSPQGPDARRRTSCLARSEARTTTRVSASFSSVRYLLRLWCFLGGPQCAARESMISSSSAWPASLVICFFFF